MEKIPVPTLQPGPTKLYPRPGMLIMNRFPSRLSRSTRRNAEMWTVRLAGSTKTSGQTRAINSCLLTSSPGRSSNTIRICRARLPRGTGLPPLSRRNCVGSSRNGPNEISVGVGTVRTRQGCFCDGLAAFESQIGDGDLIMIGSARSARGVDDTAGSGSDKPERTARRCDLENTAPGWRRRICEHDNLLFLVLGAAGEASGSRGRYVFPIYASRWLC